MAELGYVHVEGKALRQGYTTGSCAAGAAKAAAYLIVDRVLPESVDIALPTGGALTLPVQAGVTVRGGAKACIVKDGGDDPDSTHGLEVWCEVLPCLESSAVTFCAGTGVGTVTKPGLQLPVGEPAINPIPRQMIEQALKEVLPAGWGALVTLSVPGGEKAARRTLNAKLGVQGGISILGTSGIVQPMSEEAFKASLVPQLVQAQTLGYTTMILVPGRIGAKHAAALYAVPEEAVAEMSNFVGYMLMEAVANGITEVILLGHIGKLIKVAAGIFHTHNRVADARLETLAAYCALEGMQASDVRTIMANVTIEGALTTIDALGLQQVYQQLAERASLRAGEHTYGELRVGTVLLNMAGEVIGQDQAAQQIAAARGWVK
ncbi:MAG: cobalt-precorrin-5B (C(1))-methyltransferase CbiD [Peptococcaceae bacterium]|nr:cobalt-precorrin-5B (C(1))-methyltransferase CbiD [Peptococcaceae bacterium]